MKILSFGAGMQSTALALMSCENAKAFREGQEMPHPKVPIYDLVIFCDLGMEPSWVLDQMLFVKEACEAESIRFEVLPTDLYKHLMENFGERRTVSIPWWTLRADGHKSKMPRNCTLDFKVDMISKYIRWDVLGYKKGQRLRPEDKKAHQMHMGFSIEEKKRCSESPNSMFVNHFPLVELGLDRAANYAYILDVWGLDTKASACSFCPFHRNYFFQYLRENEPEHYAQLVGVDNLLREKTPKPPMDSDLFISRSRKRLEELTPEDCDDENALCIATDPYGTAFNFLEEGVMNEKTLCKARSNNHPYLSREKARIRFHSSSPSPIEQVRKPFDYSNYRRRRWPILFIGWANRNHAEIYKSKIHANHGRK